MNGKNIMGVNLEIDQEYIKQSVEEIVKAGIVAALGDPASIVKTAIDKTINMKVDRRDGKFTNSSYGSVPYLSYLAEKTVENTIKKTLEQYVEEHAEEFRQEVYRALSKKEFKRGTAEAFVSTILNNAKSQWKMPISITFEAETDE